MTLLFKTKTDINGNTYCLTINTEAKTFNRFSVVFTPETVVTVKKKDIDAMIKNCINNGYTEE